jgi:hypothetical protein
MLIPDKASFLEGIGLGVLLGAGIAYALADRFIRLSSRAAFYEGKEAALKEFRVERLVYPVEKGLFLKEYYLLIRERLILKDIPVSPFWEHMIPVAETLYADALNAVTNALANVADKLLGGADLRKIISSVFPTSISGKH